MIFDTQFNIQSIYKVTIELKSSRKVEFKSHTIVPKNAKWVQMKIDVYNISWPKSSLLR